jgi:hypothetical protein
MKVLITVQDSKGNLVRQDILESGHMMVSALYEVQLGNTVVLAQAGDIQEPYPQGFIFDLRETRVLN